MATRSIVRPRTLALWQGQPEGSVQYATGVVAYRYLFGRKTRMGSLRQKTAIVLVSIVSLLGISASTALGQDATPADAGECATTTVEENVALVEQFLAAVEEQDAETIHALLADDLVYELDRFGLEVDHTTNDDEVAMIALQAEVYPGVTHVVEEIIAQDNHVVVHQVLTIDAHLLTGELVELEETLEVDQVIIYTIECGEIVHIHGVVDTYQLLTGLGVIAPIMTEPEASPAA
jgi:ketosteroid isomerase-like protein